MFRIAPKMPPSAYKTYALSLPPQTHYRVATCQEVTATCNAILKGSVRLGTAEYCGEEHCGQYAHGWLTTIDVSTELGQRQANYIRLHSGRSFTVFNADGPIVQFKFDSHQKCFAEHQLSLEREPLYIVRGGDWRGNPRRELRQHTKAAYWIEDFANHQQKLVTEIEKG